MTQDSPSRRQDQFVLRMPDGMRERVAEEAARNNRSMNAEIVSRLEGSFQGPPRNAAAEASKTNLRLIIDAAQTHYERLIEKQEQRITELLKVISEKIDNQTAESKGSAAIKPAAKKRGRRLLLDD